jgi:hypothetical protein
LPYERSLFTESDENKILPRVTLLSFAAKLEVFRKLKTGFTTEGLERIEKAMRAKLYLQKN